LIGALALLVSACGGGFRVLPPEVGTGGSSAAGGAKAGATGQAGTGGSAGAATPAGTAGAPTGAAGDDAGGIPTGAGGIATGAGGSLAPAGEFANAAPGDILDVEIGRLRPTQGALGFDQIYYKLDRYRVDHSKELDDYCADEGLGGVIQSTAASRLDDPTTFGCIQSPARRDTSVLNPVVIGPNGDTLFVVDGHHGLTSYRETPDGGPKVHVHVRVVANHAALVGSAFWRQMQDEGWSWLRDGDDKAIAPGDLPDHLALDAGFSNDTYRSLAYFVRDVGFQKPATPVPYLEFYWARWMRRQINLKIYELSDLTSYLAAVKTSATAIVALGDGDDVSGLPAGALGRLSGLNTGEFTKLSASINESKPGKIAYALRYRGGNALPGTRYVGAQPGDLVDVALADLHPTQPVISFDQVFYKLGRYRSTKDVDAGGLNKRFDDWCEANGQDHAATVSAGARLDTPASFTCAVGIGAETAATIAAMKTAVVGPRGQVFLTDGHNTFTAFWQATDGGPAMHVRVRVLANVSYLNTAAFWQGMDARALVWLRDAEAQPITPDQLPSSLGLASFQNDRYYGLAYFARDIGYAKAPDAPEYLELYWGAWLRQNFDLGQYDLTSLPGYLDVLKASSQAMAGLGPSDVVAYDRTAFELAQLAPWNGGAPDSGGTFGKISRPLSDPAPGKIAYALGYAAP
jgi:hypothetical protein